MGSTQALAVLGALSPHSIELRAQAERCRFVVAGWVRMLFGSPWELWLGILGNRQIQHLPMNFSIDLLNVLLE
jgi:hypothetical protein